MIRHLGSLVKFLPPRRKSKLFKDAYTRLSADQRYDVRLKSIGVEKNGGNAEQSMLRKNWTHNKKTI